MHLFNAAKFNSFWQKILSYLNVFWMLIGGSTKKLLNQVCKGDRKPSGDFFYPPHMRSRSVLCSRVYFQKTKA